MSLPKTPPTILKNVFAGYYLALWNYLVTLVTTITQGFFANGGNSFSGAAVLGTNDNNALRIRTNALTRMTINASGAIAMGGAGAPGVGAAVDVQSTTGGQLIPRMTTAQRNALPTSLSLLIFNTDTNEFEFWNGTAWQPLGPPITRAQWANGTSTLLSANQFIDRWDNPIPAATHGGAPQAPIEGAPFVLRSIAYAYVGDVTNVGGQTIQFQLLVNGVAVTGGITGPLPTNLATQTTGLFTFPAQVFGPGSITCALVLTGGPLTAAVTSIYVSGGG